jgi:hypothetical protein
MQSMRWIGTALGDTLFCMKATTSARSRLDPGVCPIAPHAAMLFLEQVLRFGDDAKSG